MSILFFTEELEFKLSYVNTFKDWLASVAEEEHFIIEELNYIFTSDNYLLDINRQYLGHDYFTDIITFDYVKDNHISGDIFISVDRIKENAKTYSSTFLNELSRVMVHGLLHLCGYTDATNDEKKVMQKAEDYYLFKLELF